MIVFLDSNVLGKIAKSDLDSDRSDDESYQCKRWYDDLLRKGHRVVTSDICDYEIRRGLVSDGIRSGKIPSGIAKLDELVKDGLLEFLPVSRNVLVLASDIWANASVSGQTTSDKKNIDVDIIICAQCQVLKADNQGRAVIVATTNVRHISRFFEADNWQNIKC